MSDKKDNKISKTLLTPCRRVGLKRKSLENFSGSSTNSSPCTPLTPFNDCSSNIKTYSSITPVGHAADHSVSHSEKKLKLANFKAKKILENLPNEEIKTIENFSDVSHEDQIDESISNEDIDSQIIEIKKNISEKIAKLGIMESDSKNVKQHDLSTLNSLINKWRCGCQTALKELLHEFQNRGENCTMSILLKTLGISFELVRFSETDVDFLN